MEAMWHAGLGRSVNYEVYEVSEDPELQVGQVIAIMNGYVVADSGTPEVMEQAQQAVATNPGDPLTGIFQHVKRQMRFVHDEKLTGAVQPFYKDTFVEGLVRPVDVAAHPDLRFGDCDDFAMYTAALLRACKIPCSFVTVAADGRDPSQFTHVYVAAYPGNGERVAMDTSHGNGAGWETPVAYRVKEWPVEDGTRGWMALALVAGAGWMLYRKWGKA